MIRTPRFVEISWQYWLRNPLKHFTAVAVLHHGLLISFPTCAQRKKVRDIEDVMVARMRVKEQRKHFISEYLLNTRAHRWVINTLRLANKSITYFLNAIKQSGCWIVLKLVLRSALILTMNNYLKYWIEAWVIKRHHG